MNPKLVVDLLVEHFLTLAVNEIVETAQKNYSFADLHLRLQFLVYSLDAFQGLPQDKKNVIFAAIDELIMQLECKLQFCLTLETSAHGTIAQLIDLGYSTAELDTFVKQGFYWQETGNLFFTM